MGKRKINKFQELCLYISLRENESKGKQDKNKGGKSKVSISAILDAKAFLNFDRLVS